MTWPDDWPPEVVTTYNDLAQERSWAPVTIEAVVSSAQYIRALATSDERHQHFAGEVDGTTWLFEAVEDREELVVIRQVVIDTDGSKHRYSWECLEDSAGMLTDATLRAADRPPPATAEEFEAAWNAASSDRHH